MRGYDNGICLLTIFNIISVIIRLLIIISVNHYYLPTLMILSEVIFANNKKQILHELIMRGYIGMMGHGLVMNTYIKILEMGHQRTNPMAHSIISSQLVTGIYPLYTQHWIIGTNGTLL